MNIMMKNIFDDIKEISDLALQKQKWLNENNDTGLISSYVELMNRLFDDNNFNHFIDKEANEIGLAPNLINEFAKLRDALDNYKEKETDKEIIKDPKWIEISEQAKFIMKIVAFPIPSV